MEDDRLKGWKEIAAVLHTSERSAQRWEHQHSLPVQRHETSKSAIVFASRRELEAWLASTHGQTAANEKHGAPSDQPGRATPLRRLLALKSPTAIATALVAVAVLVVIMWTVWLPGRPDAGSRTPTPTQSPSANSDRPSASSEQLAEQVPLRLTRDGQRSTVTVPAGGMGRVTIGGHVTLGLSPVINRGGVDLDVFRIEGVAPTGGEQLTKLTTLRLEAGAPVKLQQTFGTLEIAWVPKRMAPRQNPAPPSGAEKR